MLANHYEVSVIHEKELKQILEQHELWLNTGGIKGKRANLTHADLEGTNLRNADLHGANLQGANLEGANLCWVNFGTANLRGAKFDCSILECDTLAYTKWLSTDIPWFIQHPNYAKWMNTIQIKIA